ncbi:MAG: hypothetical protein M3P38_01460 [Chloroflexota bacterium]|nr:hypothetical protein [Chloroflexota bacterium]
MRARVAWWIYAVVAGALALVVVGNWIWAVTLRGPVLYGEGAVAHAAILARQHVEYSNPLFSLDADPIFTAANYPPLFFHIAGIGDDPFVTGRVLSVVATLFIAGAIAWRARPAGVLVAATLALAWIASVPVMQWGAALKPDPVALAFTVGAVIALARDRPNHLLAGALIGAATLAKPTALVPGLALFAYVARRDPLAALRALGAGAVTAVVVFLFTYPPDEAMRLHVIDWNALPWRFELLVGLLIVAALVLAVPIVTAVATRARGGAITAYLAGAVGVLLLGGREGATINYFLDLSAALALTAASLAPRLALRPMYPLASLAQLTLAVVLLNPFAGSPSLLQPTGKWGSPERIAFVRDNVPGTVLVEDSGLLVATGREPIVDDLFLWSRLYGSGRIEGGALLEAVRGGRFDAIVTEVDLERLDVGPGYARQRWHADLVAAVLERYQMPTRTLGLCRAFVWCQQLYVYTRR